MIYQNYERNHVIRPGSEEKLKEFLGGNYKGMQHKRKNGISSHSEDALTWSCFDLIRTMDKPAMVRVLNEMFEDAYGDNSKLVLSENDHIDIEVGKYYKGANTGEDTEVDASIELPGKLIFFEAKLYSSISMATQGKTHDQIARKLRVGLDSPLGDSREFYFIFLDIAPPEKLVRRKSKEEALSSSKGGYDDKWKSAWVFNYYKSGRNGSHKPLKVALDGILLPSGQTTNTVASNMGWLTWSDLFKSVLRGTVMP